MFDPRSLYPDYQGTTVREDTAVTAETAARLDGAEVNTVGEPHKKIGIWIIIVIAVLFMAGIINFN